MIKKLKSITHSAVRPDRPERWKSMPKHGLKLKILAIPMLKLNLLLFLMIKSSTSFFDKPYLDLGFLFEFSLNFFFEKPYTWAVEIKRK